MSIRLVLAAAVVTPLLMPAADAGTVPVGAFKQVALHGGGHIVLKHGATQSVSLIAGSTDVTSFTIQDGTELVIDTCGNTVVMCPVHYDLDIEITSPDIQGVSIHGGGEIATEGAFPAQNNLAVDIHGGGEIDVRGIDARDVAAAVHDGGGIKLTATHSLVASIHGGGDITFRGHPSLVESIHGGGDIDSED
ncbi:MAG: DUF2807 domain-containing protein [Alphaproteobacteria bacterium]|nr:DUF2807 domain-containing protein [Alphaproteobacteria bacterium]MBL6939689.1 DUF2807 domain-containing protein [Alphaproteobacteria bacterium]MBL7096989.1 DUF2807 domain-containing protein [Alphaproteobacteria bacterium]